MKTVYVITCADVNDPGEWDVIGVADSPSKAKEMIKEYYGPNTTLSEFRYVRDSGIEFKQKAKYWTTLSEEDVTTEIITVLYFNINQT